MYKYNERDVQTRRAIHSRGRKKLWVKCDRFIDRHSRDERKIRLKITSLGKFGVSTTNVDTPIARSWSFRLFFFFLFLLRQKTQTGRGFLMSRRVSVLCNRWTSHESVPLPPSPPSSTPDRYQTPRVFGVSSSTPVDFPRTVSNRDDCSRARCSWKREKKKKRKDRVCTPSTARAKVRPFVVDVRSRQRSPSKDRYVDEGQRVGFLRDNAIRCRLCNCNKRI